MLPGEVDEGRAPGMGTHPSGVPASPCSPHPLASPQFPSPKHIALVICVTGGVGVRGIHPPYQRCIKAQTPIKPNPAAPGTCPDSLQLEADGLGTELLIYLFPSRPRPHPNPQSRSHGRVDFTTTTPPPPPPPPAPRRSLALVTGRRLPAPGGRDALPLVARLARPWVPAAGEAGGRWRVTDVLL